MASTLGLATWELRSFSWRGVGVFLLFTVALAAWTWSGILLTPKPLSFHDHADYFVGILQRNLFMYFPAYVLVALADGLPLHGTRRNVVLGAALVLGILLAVQVRCAVRPNDMFYVYGTTMSHYCTSFPTWRTYIDFPASWITPLTIGAMVMIFVFGHRRDAALVAALYQVRSAQIESRRQRIESDLEAVQSRVDPDALFDKLGAIRARYETSLEEGERLLDALIGDLREAARRPVTP